MATSLDTGLTEHVAACLSAANLGATSSGPIPNGMATKVAPPRGSLVSPCFDLLGPSLHSAVEQMAVEQTAQIMQALRVPAHTASPFCSAASEILSAFGKVASEGLGAGGICASAGSPSVRGCCVPPALQSCIGAIKRGSDCEALRADSCRAGDSFSSIASSSLATNTSSFSVNVTSILPGQHSCPAHGIKAVCGKRSKMEDMYQVQPNFFDLPVSPCSDEAHNKMSARLLKDLDADAAASPPASGGSSLPTASMLAASPGSSMPMSPIEGGGGPLSADQETSVGGGSTGSDSSSSDTLHFYGVYDGHGGSEASAHCANRLHHHLSESLNGLCGALASGAVQCFDLSKGVGGHVCQAEWSLAMHGKAGSRGVAVPAASMAHAGSGAAAAGGPAPPSLSASPLSSDSPPQGDAMTNSSGATSSDMLMLGEASDNDSDAASDTSGSGGRGSARSTGDSAAASISGVVEEAMRDAFMRTDAEFARDGVSNMVGSTAVVALVGSRKLWVANCGDSRAVLCRASKAIQLTDDHKPEREDEAERVERAGGQVLYWNGHRVMGVLAMSRAIGDHALRPYVICEPEVTVMSRTDDDDFLLLASDGLWDVMSNQEATNLAFRCIGRARQKGASRRGAVRIAANVLTTAAMDRGSKDNVTVLIIDLSPNGPPATSAAVPDAEDEAVDDPLNLSLKSNAGSSTDANGSSSSTATGGPPSSSGTANGGVATSPRTGACCTAALARTAA